MLFMNKIGMTTWLGLSVPKPYFQLNFFNYKKKRFDLSKGSIEHSHSNLKNYWTFIKKL